MHFLDSLEQELSQCKTAGLLRRRRLLESAQGAHIRVDGREVLSFCSNDYLGLANHPALIAAAKAAANDVGVGSGASHLITGHHRLHHELEESLAHFVGLPQALLFSTGYMANLGIVTALAGRGDAVFADRLNHASLNDAVVLSRAELKRYPHSDMAALEKLLASSQAKRKLVLTDAVFSMDGDIAPITELLALCEKYDAWLMLDDAHGFGVLGTGGRGVLEHLGLKSPRIIYMATLGKAAGVAGAFVAGEPALIETLVQNARTYIYTTALPPLLAAALLASLKLIEAEGWRRVRIGELVAALRGGLSLQRWQLAESVTPIQPLVIGSNDEALMVSERLLERGILVPAIRPPTVPKGTARLRISLSAAHTPEDVARLLDAINEIERL
ncbi:MAG: 8-amino-7-oxononanoate synthase [Methylophilales bacterium RIFCSPHIGHO2_02_FULL_57_10]|nr:MAG: 8-amino-7-oxononanoate synthase [Methylophilales bacterium RIFCSPHIGHO2_02_FULL_57_10]